MSRRREPCRRRGRAQNLRAFAAMAALVLPACAQDFDWAALLGRQDLWPAHCALLLGVQQGDTVLPPGTIIAVERLVGDAAVVTYPGVELPGYLPPRGCNVLEQARTAFAAMTEAQRRFDCAAMRRRGDLWPESVSLLRPWRVLVDGKPRTFDEGTELVMGCFDGQWLRVGIPGVDGAREVAVHFTDFASQLRAALLDPPAARPMRVLGELDGLTYDPGSGRKVALGPKAAPRFLALYFAAVQEAPGRQSAVELAQFCNQHRKQRGQVFEVVWISRDRSQRAMQERARAERFPWLAVRWDALSKVRMVQAHGLAGGPRLCVLDAAGSVVADSSGGKAEAGLAAVLEEFGKLLDAK